MIRFDDAIDVAISVLKPYLGDSVDVVVVRDATGALSLVLPDDALAASHWADTAALLDIKLAPFSLGADRVLLRTSDLVDPADVLDSADRVRLPEYQRVFLVDRLLTNQDWLRRPLLTTPPLPVATAFSIKGGVGRSTAVAVWAWHLARLGKRVFVIDLDLEAPGIGKILLSDLPDYGLVDWLTESLVAQGTPQLLDDAIQPSSIAEGTPGVVHVLPALGSKTREYVSKVGRVYMPGVTSDGQLQGLAHRLEMLVRQISKRPEPPDVVLLDARAGLHDVGAAAVTQLGAEAFLFARNDSQTWDAYSHLFKYLSRAHGVTWGMPDSDLRWRLKMVAAQLESDEKALDRFVEMSYEVWSDLYDDEDTADQGSTALPDGRQAEVFSREDSSAPHSALPIFFDPALRNLDLASPDKRPDWRVIEAAFGGFLIGATDRLLTTEVNS